MGWVVILLKDVYGYALGFMIFNSDILYRTIIDSTYQVVRNSEQKENAIKMTREHKVHAYRTNNSN